MIRDKKRIRNRIKQIRNSMPDYLVQKNSIIIFKNIINFKQFKDANLVFTYVNFKNEVKTDSLIKHCISNNKRIAVPICNTKDKTLRLSELKSFPEELEKKTMGIMEPRSEYFRAVELCDIDIAFIPGIAFDYRGYRIGFGAGYYDRLMSNKTHDFCTVGLCYQFQLISNVPEQSHDFAVDYIITEKGIIKTVN